MSTKRDNFKAMSEIMRFHRHSIVPKYQAYGLYRGQPILLFLLNRKNGRTASELAEKMNVEPATITKMTKRMESAGYIERKKDPEDNRKIRIYLTEKSKAILDEIQSIDDDVTEKLFTDFSDDELDMLFTLLSKVKYNAQRMREGD